MTAFFLAKTSFARTFENKPVLAGGCKILMCPPLVKRKMSDAAG